MHGYTDTRRVLNAASDKEINNPDAASKRSVKRRRRITPSARINPAKPGFRRELRSPALHRSLTEHRFALFTPFVQFTPHTHFTQLAQRVRLTHRTHIALVTRLLTGRRAPY